MEKKMLAVYAVFSRSLDYVIANGLSENADITRYREAYPDILDEADNTLRGVCEAGEQLAKNATTIDEHLTLGNALMCGFTYKDRQICVIPLEEYSRLMKIDEYMGRKVHSYWLEIAADPSKCHLHHSELEVVFETEEQVCCRWPNSESLSVYKKADFEKCSKRFVPKDYIFKYAQYNVDLLTSSSDTESALKKMKKALESLVKENFLLSLEQIKSLDLKALLKD